MCRAAKEERRGDGGSRLKAVVCRCEGIRWVSVALLQNSNFHNSILHRHLSISRWVRLVIQRFLSVRSMPVAAPITARGAGAAFIHTPITSRALGGLGAGDRSRN